MQIHSRWPNFHHRFTVFVLVCCAVFTLADRAHGQYNWSEPTFAEFGENPNFVIDPNTGIIHLVTITNPQGGVWYQKITPDGIRFHSEPVPGAERDLGWKNFHAVIDVDSAGDPHIGYRFYDYFAGPYWDLFYINKKDSVWSDPVTVALDVDHGYVESMVMDSKGRIHLTQSQRNLQLKETYGADYGDVLYYRIVDGVVDIRSMITDPTVMSYRVDDRFELGITSNDWLHLIVSNPDFHVGTVNYYRSRDNGQNWELINDIHSPQSPTRNGFADISVDTSDNIHFCYGTMYDQGIQNNPSVRYIRYWREWPTRETIATGAGDIKEGWACGSVAASEDGQYICIAFTSFRGYGPLYATISEDGGITWSDPQKIADYISKAEWYGRNYHVAKAYKNNFYVIYPYDGQSYLTFLRHIGDDPPVADAGGPYTGMEGQTVELDMSGTRDSGQNPGIVEYAWDWDGDGSYDFTTANARLDYVFEDDYTGSAVLRVTDHAGQMDYDTTTISVANRNPDFSVSGDRLVHENELFTLTCDVMDPGILDTHTLSWDMGDGTVLTGTDTTVEHRYPDEGDGQYIVTITVTDDDGGVSQDTLHITVLNLPPVADSQGPYAVAPRDTLTVTGTGSDPGAEDVLVASWDTDANGSFETPGWSTEIVFQATGTYNIFFKVEDLDGGIDIDTTYVDVNNAPPQLSTIPGQTINEGGVFEPVSLGEYVSDPEHEAEELSWEYYGQHDLLVSLEEMLFSVAVPDSEWAGEEVITLIASDPLGLSDSTEIRYTVLAVNDPPAWKSMLTYEIEEDDTLRIPLSQLQSNVSDIDNAPGELEFTVLNTVHIHGETDVAGDQWLFYADADWYGEESFLWTVSDPDGLQDTMSTHIRFTPLEDKPRSFTVIAPVDVDSTAWPDTVNFIWHSTTDPDSNDYVFYQIKLQTQGGGTAAYAFESGLLADTTFMFVPPAGIGNGIFFWWVNALDLSGDKTSSSNHGTFNINDNSPVEEAAAAVPEAYELLQNHPNPFNPETVISYHLPGDTEITLAVYNMLGQKICVLDHGRRSAGVHTVVWRGLDDHYRQVPSGLYLYRLDAGGSVFIRKMLFIQ
ncbi:cadherin-like domain-containing protein [bacterium]|nr:cadherin-like domain-containing protein [bacterium]